MIERPILFSAPMVRAILAGQKTQTRRVVKWRGLAPGLNLGFSGLSVERSGSNFVLTSPTRTSHEYRSVPQPSPYGTPGDRLWVRETFYCDDFTYPDGLGVSAMWREVDGKRVPVPVEEQRKRMLEDMYYRADGEPEWEAADGRTPWRPSIHMPSWASRITLNITGVRVERLQAISREDAIAEGIEQVGHRWRHYAFPTEDSEAWEFPQNSFGSLWASINGAESWDANPWVWVVEFERVET